MHNLSLRYASAPILLLVSALNTAPAGAPCAWAQEKPIYSFTGGADGNFPESGVIIDKLGNIYGTTVNGGSLPSCEGFGCGSVFELTRTARGRWKEITLYDFA